MKVLIAECSADIQTILGGACEVIGHGSIFASNSTELQYLLTAHYTDIALLVLAWDLPGQEGEASLRLIREDPRFSRLPVLVLTATGANPLPSQILAAGATDCLARNATQEDLITRMYECVSRAA